MYYDQSEYTIRCEWGLTGLTELLPHSDVVIIIDVLSFTTCVDIGVGNEALIYPFRGTDDEALALAASLGAELAHRGPAQTTGYSLSPSALQDIPAGTKLILPSPNGSLLSTATGNVPTLAGCLRNAAAVARMAQSIGNHISVIPAGERWRKDRSLRPSLEDMLGAGAIISQLQGKQSPEAEAAEAVFRQMKDSLTTALRGCSSGKELVGRGRAPDVDLAAMLNVSEAVPILIDNAYQLPI